MYWCLDYFITHRLDPCYNGFLRLEPHLLCLTQPASTRQRYRRLCKLLVKLTCFLKLKTIIWKLLISGKYCEQYNNISYNFWQKCAILLICLNIIMTTVFTHISFFKNINIIMFENWQGIYPMVLGASLSEY